MGRLRRVLPVALLALALSGCSTMSAVLDVTGQVLGAFAGVGGNPVTVVNLCTGADTTVDVYLNGAHMGQVLASRTLSIPTGTHTLRARGTGRGGTEFVRTTYVSGPLRWTLCP